MSFVSGRPPRTRTVFFIPIKNPFFREEILGPNLIRWLQATIRGPAINSPRGTAENLAEILCVQQSIIAQTRERNRRVLFDNHPAAARAPYDKTAGDQRMVTLQGVCVILAHSVTKSTFKAVMHWLMTHCTFTPHMTY